MTDQQEPKTPYNTPPPPFPPKAPGGFVAPPAIPAPPSASGPAAPPATPPPAVQAPRPASPPPAMPPTFSTEPGAPGDAGSGGTRLPLVVAAVAAVIALAAVVFAGASWNQARQLETQLVAAQDQLADVVSEQRGLASTVSAVAGDVGDLQAATGESLSSYLAGLDRAITEAQSDATDALLTAESLSGRTQALVECVNDYMKTVGDSGGGYYRYYFCR